VSTKKSVLDGDPRLVSLLTDVYVFGSYPFAGLVVTEEGCVAIDGPMSPRNSIPWKEFIDLQGRLRYQIYCEHHEDHVASAFYLRPEVLITSEQTRAEMPSTTNVLDAFRSWGYDPELEQDALDSFEVHYPTLTYAGHMNITLGGKRFVLFNAPGHTAGSTVVHAVDDRVAFIADNGFTPAIQSGDPFAWLTTLSVLESLDVDWYVQGHGDPFRRDDFAAWRQVLLRAVDGAREMKAAGLTPAEVVRRGGVFPHYSRPEHRGTADRPPKLDEFSSSVLQAEGARRMFAALDRHPTELPAPVPAPES
jgi:glyoxylase-like metal-dependent hydrolase (beta-lactamase superfamily II)